MHIHILGICGTFMGGLALLAKQAGHKVSGSDANVYPPMSDQLLSQGIDLMEGYEAAHLQPRPDMVVIGNALSRGNAAIEHVLSTDLPYTSGPQWLAEHFLKDHWVLAVSGTHGKTTTASILAWILEYAGLKPGFLIGGVPGNFGVSARAGDKPFFVIEADEYDTAFFDKRSKFIHYRPRTLIMNNLEFDHADIFDNLLAIQKQFHHLVRTVPGNGLIIHNCEDSALGEVLDMGCWTPCESFSASAGGDWTIDGVDGDTKGFKVLLGGEVQGMTSLSLPGIHNQSNALAAIAAARHAGVPVSAALEAVMEFSGVRRRLELRGEKNGVSIYDDFAHHPTAIALTVSALRRQIGNARIVAVLEPRSNTMKMGVHAEMLGESLKEADRVYLYRPEDIGWDLQKVADSIGSHAGVHDNIDELVRVLAAVVRPGDHVLVMSNGGFGGIHQRLLDAI